MMRRMRIGSALLALALGGCASVVAPPQRAGTPAATVAAGHPAVPDPALPVLPAAGSGHGAYYQDDGPGENPPAGLLDVGDAEARVEPYSLRANRPYVVFGKTYTPLTHTEEFTQRGVASWYGKKFHGQRTSSGELYDMYKMTAAHPTLPIPSYARVTSQVSGKQVIVRINDRGPFHAKRVIDVSYTAALKLGLLGAGSHEVKIERLLPAEIYRMAAQRARAGEAGTTVAEPVAPAVASAPAVAPAPAVALATVVAPAPAVALATVVAAAPVRAGSGARAAARSTARAAAAMPPVVAGAVAPLAAASQADPDMAALMLENRMPQTGDLVAINAASPAAVFTEEAAASANGQATGAYYLQLGSYGRLDNAQSARSRLAQAGAALGALEVVLVGKLHRLFSGPFRSRADAQAAAQAVPPALNLKPIVIQR